MTTSRPSSRDGAEVCGGGSGEGVRLIQPYRPAVLASWLAKCLPPSGLAFERSVSSLGSPPAPWLETGSCTFLPSGVPVALPHPDDERRHLDGVDRHRPSQGIPHRSGHRPRRNQARRAATAVIQTTMRPPARLGGGVPR